MAPGLKINMDRLRGTVKRSKTSDGSTRQLDDGKNYFRALPFPDPRNPGEFTLVAEVGQHFKISDEIKAACCRLITWDLWCPTCEGNEALIATNKEADKVIAEERGGRKSYLFVGYDPTDEQPMLQKLVVNGKAMRAMMAYLLDTEEYPNINDKDKGQSLIVTKSPEKDSKGKVKKFNGYVVSTFDIKIRGNVESVPEALWEKATTFDLSVDRDFDPNAKIEEICEALGIEPPPFDEVVEEEVVEEEVVEEEVVEEPPPPPPKATKPVTATRPVQTATRPVQTATKPATTAAAPAKPGSALLDRVKGLKRQ